MFGFPIVASIKYHFGLNGSGARTNSTPGSTSTGLPAPAYSRLIMQEEALGK